MIEKQLISASCKHLHWLTLNLQQVHKGVSNKAEPTLFWFMLTLAWFILAFQTLQGHRFEFCCFFRATVKKIYGRPSNEIGKKPKCKSWQRLLSGWTSVIILSVYNFDWFNAHTTDHSCKHRCLHFNIRSYLCCSIWAPSPRTPAWRISC